MDEMPLHIVVDRPYLYGLNPEHPEINGQGLRDDPVAVPKQGGVWRSIVLGDSVAYGVGVPSDRTFPNRLEQLLRRTEPTAEVVNAGVQGYTTYSELKYYQTSGREFEADTVILALVLNDVVDPRTHWGYTAERLLDIPEEAVPDPDNGAGYGTSASAKQSAGRRSSRARSLLERFELFDLFEDAASAVRERERGREERRNFESAVPTYVSGGSGLSIKVLTDESTREWQWLTSMLDRLHDATSGDGARLLVVVIPLAYQLNPGYPFLPQTLIEKYCRSRDIPCLDLLPAFRRHPKRDLFLLDAAPRYDIWHLTERGHDVAAKAILEFLHTTGAGPRSTTPVAPAGLS
jgi:hypothetical protein